MCWKEQQTKSEGPGSGADSASTLLGFGQVTLPLQPKVLLFVNLDYGLDQCLSALAVHSNQLESFCCLAT